MHGRKESVCIKNMSPTSGLLDEVEGIVQGHRDGHGFVSRDDGAPDIYLPPNEMRAVLHKDRVKVRIVRSDRKGRPEGRVVEIVERSTQPIIGRLLQESGVWLVAPEDKRYGQDVLIPKGATSGPFSRITGVRPRLFPPPAIFSPGGNRSDVSGVRWSDRTGPQAWPRTTANAVSSFWLSRISTRRSILPAG